MTDAEKATLLAEMLEEALDLLQWVPSFTSDPRDEIALRGVHEDIHRLHRLSRDFDTISPMPVATDDEASYWMKQHHAALARAEALDADLKRAIAMMVRFVEEEDAEEQAHKEYLRTWRVRRRPFRVYARPNRPTRKVRHDLTA